MNVKSVCRVVGVGNAGYLECLLGHFCDGGDNNIGHVCLVVPHTPQPKPRSQMDGVTPAEYHIRPRNYCSWNVHAQI
jgi:hypothetical protein